MDIRNIAVIFTALIMVFIPKVLSESSDSTEQPPSEESQPVAAVTTYVSADVVSYLNRRIRQVLLNNPKRNPADLRLAEVFNEERRKLGDFIIVEPATEDKALKAEQAIDNFRAFVQHYIKIEHMLENALDNLNNYEDDLSLPIESRYMALMLVLKLRNSSTLKDGEKALRLFVDFKEEFGKGDIKISTNEAPFPQLDFPPLKDEYKEYFEEILSILKHHSINDTLKVENLLEQILVNTDELKLSAALKEISAEDYYNEEEEEINLNFQSA